MTFLPPTELFPSWLVCDKAAFRKHFFSSAGKGEKDKSGDAVAASIPLSPPLPIQSEVAMMELHPQLLAVSRCVPLAWLVLIF